MFYWMWRVHLVFLRTRPKNDQGQGRRPVNSGHVRGRNWRLAGAFDPSAAPGRVMVAGGGQVLMEVGDARIELRGGLPGTVIQVMNERGVVIRTAGALIQGTWGNGRIDNGLLVSLIDKPDAVLTADRLDQPARFGDFRRACA